MNAIRYPLEFSRTQRPLAELKTYKANEFRNILYYLVPYLFYEILPTQYYNHALIYTTFIRLLTMNKIQEEDILNAQVLIDNFYKKFKSLYGKEYLTYKLHTHIHLPMQVLTYGAINLISAFPFESKFNTILIKN